MTQDRIIRVFVYGTLKRGYGNNRLLRDGGAKFICEARTSPGYFLYACPGFPYMCQGTGPMKSAFPKGVLGEVWEVNTRTLAALDRLEGHPNHYVRISITLANGEIVSTYILPAKNARRYTWDSPISDVWPMENNNE